MSRGIGIKECERIGKKGMTTRGKKKIEE